MTKGPGTAIIAAKGKPLHEGGSKMMLVSVALLSAAVSATDQIAPWGVCAHLGGHEFDQREQELSLMQQAGIRWARADFTWAYFQPQRDKWQFERYDQLVASAAQYGVELLPILCYNVDWAFPAHEHLEDWCRYVATVVARYRDRIRYWEVWNEPNIGFWKPRPNPEEYARLLVATYTTIKQVAPEAQVVFGGTAGVPVNWIKQVFDCQAFGSFDVLAVHPYRYPAAPEVRGIPEDLRAVNSLVRDYGGGKKLWITEIGWPTHINPAVADEDFLPSMIRYAARLRFPERTKLNASVLFEPDLPGTSAQLSEQITRRLSAISGWQVKVIGLAQLPTIDPRDVQVLVMPTGEHYPADYFDHLLRFVRDGGLLVHLGGVPLYYASRQRDGQWESPHAGEGPREALHVGWKAWWTEKGVPEHAQTSKVVAPHEAGIALPKIGPLRSHRWLTDARLKGQDKFIPFLAAFNGDQLVGYPVALFLYDSDLKGAFLSVCLDLGISGVTEKRQAVYLPRAFMVALASGVENVFWYEFRDGGDDPTYNEHRFGIIRNDLTPKPAYEAYAAMTRALGAGRFVQALDVGAGTLCYVFDTGTGARTAAIWRSSGEARVRLRVHGTGVRFTDYRGRIVSVARSRDAVELTATEQVTYIIGANKVEPVE
ncbi:MAG: beta-galactosidase [Armatimonadetes bacterium]|nr:beta-galactosidase [Armatimonadota bacterium]